MSLSCHVLAEVLAGSSDGTAKGIQLFAFPENYRSHIYYLSIQIFMVL